MNRLIGSRARGENFRGARRSQQVEEEEIIRVPAFDNSDLIEKFN